MARFILVVKHKTVKKAHEPIMWTVKSEAIDCLLLHKSCAGFSEKDSFPDINFISLRTTFALNI